MTTKYDLSGEYHADVSALMNRVSELEDVLRLTEEPCRAFYKQARDGGWEVYSAVQEALKDRTLQVIDGEVHLIEVRAISCEDRLPTEEDEDVNGNVWGWYQYRFEWLLVPSCVFTNTSDICTHWMHTGLKNPGYDPIQ